MKPQARFLLLALFFSMLATPALAQSTAPPTTTPPPAIMVIEPTPIPSPTPQGNLLQQVWETNRAEILLGFIAVVVSSILVGVFLRQIAETLSGWASRLFHFLFDRFASAPILRLRYEKRYRETLSTALQTLASSNIVDRDVRLDQVYVPVHLTEETQPGGTTTFEDRLQWDEDRRRRQRQRAVEPWEAVRRFQRLVVLGEPGAGKTTYLHHLAFMCAQRKRLPDYTPIFIELRNLVGAGRLEDALPAEFARRSFPNAGPFIERRLADGLCLVLLDGLDEVENEAHHQEVVSLVKDFSDRNARHPDHDSGPRNIIVVSSRTYSYEHGPQLTGFTRTMVMDFDDPAIERFAHNWFQDGDLRPLAGELLAVLDGNRRFKELARNPLLLLLIVYHYERERNLPDLRAELYRHCIRTRITRWNVMRGTHRGRFGETDKWRMLRELALDLYRREQQGLIDREALLLWLDGFAAGLRLPEGMNPADLLDEVVRTSGLVQERAIERYGFSHLTLQEYFAAEGVDRLGAQEGAKLLGEHLPNPRWQEVILLYCGLADDAAPLLRRVLQRTGDDGPDAWLQAARCLAEGARVADDELCHEAARGLVGLLREVEAGDQEALTAEESGEVVAALQSFAVPELPGHVRALLASQEPGDALLAARLLPEGGEPELRAEVSRRMAALARGGETVERRIASAALGWVSGADSSTVAVLRAGLADPDPAARAEAARALGRLRASDETTIAGLLQIYGGDPEDDPRHAALEALLALGRAAGLGLVPVPAGEFLMGSADDDRQAEANERPQHRLYLPAYYIDRVPVTNVQYGRFVEAGGYAQSAYWAEAIEAGHWEDGAYVEHEVLGGKHRRQPVYWEDPKWNSGDLPVVGVTWYEALAYARWAGKRLPSEAEWEKAARWDPEARRSHTYPWGNEWDAERCNTKESGTGRTTPVLQFSPRGDSPCGAAGMAGNVWEWCSTRWGPAYPYDPNDGREDLAGGDDIGRILRGGSWYNDKSWARCAYRFGDDPYLRDYDGGFRCCCATSSPSPGSGS